MKITKSPAVYTLAEVTEEDMRLLKHLLGKSSPPEEAAAGFKPDTGANLYSAISTACDR